LFEGEGGEKYPVVSKKKKMAAFLIPVTKTPRPHLRVGGRNNKNEKDSMSAEANRAIS